MSENTAKCIMCEVDSQNIPLLRFEFKGEEYNICSQHIPVLIHKPAQLADKLSGIDPTGSDHAH